MPDDDKWKWLTNPLIGVKALPSTPGSLNMRKAQDLTVHRDPSAPDDGQSQGAGRGDLNVPTSGGKDDKKDEDGDSQSRDPDRDASDKREKQQEQAKQPNQDRMTDAAKEVLKKYAEDNLGRLKDKALDDLAKAWKESPGGVITVGAILGAAGVAYLVKTGNSLPSIPPIPLDFLAKRAPIFKGAEFKVEVKGPITGPDSFMVSVTFHEQAGGKEPKSGSGRGKVLPLRLTLKPGGATSESPEPGAELDIEGAVAIPSDASTDDVSATIKALKDAKVEVDVGGTPANSVEVLNVEDNYKPGPYGLGSPPRNRALTVRLRSSLPPMLHQGKDEIAEAPVWVRINRISNEGEAKIKVHFQPVSSRAGN